MDGEAMTKPADQIAKARDDCQNTVYLELRRIYCCKGAEFSRPTLEKAWKEIQRMEHVIKKLLDRLQIHQELSEKGADWAGYAMELRSASASERQAVIEDCAKMADQIAKSCSACSYSREKHGEEPSFCENFGCSSFADLATAIRSME